MKVLELLADESKWTQHALARNNLNRAVSFKSAEAVSFCLEGALGKCYKIPEKYLKLSALIRERFRIRSITSWNDDESRTFEDVRKLITELDI